MKYLILIVILLLIPISAYATHQNQSTQCSISINGEILSVTYITQERINSNGSFYPGDGFHYLFTFTGIEECLSFSVNPVVSEGIFNVISHNSIIWNNPTEKNHSHNDFEMQPKYLTTTHYYVDKISYTNCDTGRCQSVTIADSPVYSLREDKKPSYGLKKLLDGRSTASTYSVRTAKTQDWGFTNMDGSHKHNDYSHIKESDKSIESFENYVKSKCSNLEKYSGCMFGHVEFETILVDKKCMFEELEKMSVIHNIEEDFCVDVNHNLSLTIQGTKRNCTTNDKGKIVCKTIPIVKSKNINPNILSSEFEIILTDQPVKDRDNYNGKNKDGTYYPHDPIGIIHNPSLLWKNDRSETIQFVTTKQYDITKEYEYDCNFNKCDHKIELNSVYPAMYDFGNGEGITIYNSTRNDFGINNFDYKMTAKNIDREIYTTTNTIDSETVDYFPQFKSYPYPLLKDNQELAFDDRQGVVLYYFGSIEDDKIYEQRRSKINYVYNIGVGYDPFIPKIIKQNFTLDEGVTVSEDVLLSHNQTAVFSQSGYGKIYFDYPLSDIVIPSNIPRFENVTSYTTLISDDFADKDTILQYYSMRYPEIPFTKNLIVKSINQNGTIINDSITIRLEPYMKIGAEYITGYIFDKIKFDTDDKIFAETIANDTYPMKQEYSGNGILNVTISKTGLFFDEFIKQNNSGDSKFSDKIDDLSSLIKTPDTIRLTAPYDIGLSVLSPTSLTITVNKIENTFDERYYSFGDKQTIIINTQKDNELYIDRDFGKIIIYPPSNFGFINAIYVDEKIIKQECKNGCVLLFQPNKELIISVENVWGGTASTTSPEIIPFIPPQSDEPNYSFISAIFLILIMGYLIYRKFKQK